MPQYVRIEVTQGTKLMNMSLHRPTSIPLQSQGYYLLFSHFKDNKRKRQGEFLSLGCHSLLLDLSQLAGLDAPVTLNLVK